MNGQNNWSAGQSQLLPLSFLQQKSFARLPQVCNFSLNTSSSRISKDQIISSLCPLSVSLKPPKSPLSVFCPSDSKATSFFRIFLSLSQMLPSWCVSLFSVFVTTSHFTPWFQNVDCCLKKLQITKHFYYLTPYSRWEQLDLWVDLFFTETLIT